MPQAINEAVIIVLDSSRSMLRNDYSPTRLEACKKAILKFLESRINSDASNFGNSSFALINYNTKAKSLIKLGDRAKLEKFQEVLPSIKNEGNSVLGDAIGKAIQMLIESIRENGAFKPKIFIFSDGNATPGSVDPQKMAMLAKQLEIPISTFAMGEPESFNLLKRISEITNGTFYHVEKVENMIKFADELGYSNTTQNVPKKRTGFTQVDKKVAVPLKTAKEMTDGSETQKETIERLRGSKDYEKCSICFMSKDPTSASEFNISGRYCPNCGKPMHASCASMWAKSNDKVGDGTVLRCPQCFYLIKIPKSVYQFVSMHEKVKRQEKRGELQETQEYHVSPINANLLGDSARYNACAVCSNIFDDLDKVVSCGNHLCNSIYHLSCFQKLRGGQCKSCGSKLILDQ